MNYVKEVLVVTYFPWNAQKHPMVDVEFHRSNGKFKNYENITSEQLKRICGALKNVSHPNNTSVTTEFDAVIANYRI
jgi:hypothetical protein